MQFNRLAGEADAATNSGLWSHSGGHGFSALAEHGGCFVRGNARLGIAVETDPAYKNRNGEPRGGNDLPKFPVSAIDSVKALLLLSCSSLFCSGLLSRRFLSGSFAFGGGFFLCRFFRCFLGGFLGWCHRILPVVDLGGAIRLRTTDSPARWLCYLIL